jgi:hypothetical protein
VPEGFPRVPQDVRELPGTRGKLAEDHLLTNDVSSVLSDLEVGTPDVGDIRHSNNQRCANAF